MAQTPTAKAVSRDSISTNFESVGVSFPLIKILDVYLTKAEIESLEISCTNILPTMTLVINTGSKTLLKDNAIADGTLVSIYCSEISQLVKPYRGDFLITNVQTKKVSQEKIKEVVKFYIFGELYIPGYHDSRWNFAYQGTSRDALIDVATQLKLSYSFNDSDNTNDPALWICSLKQGESIEKYIKDIGDHAYKDTSTYFDYFIDLRYSLTMINVPYFLGTEDKDCDRKNGFDITEAISNMINSLGADGQKIMKESQKSNDVSMQFKMLHNFVNTANSLSPWYVTSYKIVNRTGEITSRIGLSQKMSFHLNNQNIPENQRDITVDFPIIYNKDKTSFQSGSTYYVNLGMVANSDPEIQSRMNESANSNNDSTSNANLNSEKETTTQNVMEQLNAAEEALNNQYGTTDEELSTEQQQSIEEKQSVANNQKSQTGNVNSITLASSDDYKTSTTNSSTNTSDSENGSSNADNVDNEPDNTQASGNKTKEYFIGGGLNFINKQQLKKQYLIVRTNGLNLGLVRGEMVACALIETHKIQAFWELSGKNKTFQNAVNYIDWPATGWFYISSVKYIFNPDAYIKESPNAQTNFWQTELELTRMEWPITNFLSDDITVNNKVEFSITGDVSKLSTKDSSSEATTNEDGTVYIDTENVKEKLTRGQITNAGLTDYMKRVYALLQSNEINANITSAKRWAVTEDNKLVEGNAYVTDDSGTLYKQVSTEGTIVYYSNNNSRHLYGEAIDFIQKSGEFEKLFETIVLNKEMLNLIYNNGLTIIIEKGQTQDISSAGVSTTSLSEHYHIGTDNQNKQSAMWNKINAIYNANNMTLGNEYDDFYKHNKSLNELSNNPNVKEGSYVTVNGGSGSSTSSANEEGTFTVNKAEGQSDFSSLVQNANMKKVLKDTSKIEIKAANCQKTQYVTKSYTKGVNGWCIWGPITWYKNANFNLKFWKKQPPTYNSTYSGLNAGFVPVWHGNKSALHKYNEWRPGDVCTIYTGKESKSSGYHGVMYTGKDFRSDFLQTQADCYANQSNPNDNDPYYAVIWRQPSCQEDGAVVKKMT